MSMIILRKSRDPLDLLERMLNNTTLTTQRVTHRHVLRAGENVMKENFVDVDGEKDRAVKAALIEADKRHGREIKSALRKLEREMEDDKSRALHRQQKYFEELASRVAEQRDKAEEQRRRELKRHYDQVREEALADQWEEAERLKAIAVQEACDALQKHLRNEFAIEKEKAIAEALAIAREKFRIREQESITRTRKQCEQEAAEEAARVAKLHAEEIARHEKRYQTLMQKYEKEIDHKRRVESDFADLQTDYKRFMNYTDGQYHADYMMRLRRHGLGLSNKRVSVVTYEDIERLDGHHYG